MLDFKRALAAKPCRDNHVALTPLSTTWGQEVQDTVQVLAPYASPRDAAGDSSEAAFPGCALPNVPSGGSTDEQKTRVPRSEHPNPQFARDSYMSLNGWWMCAFSECMYDPKESAHNVCALATKPSRIETPILVPFSPEAALSDVGRQLLPDELLWYRAEISLPEWKQPASGSRLLLHFEAVDDTCAVWCNGMLLGTHEGGYLPFCFDVTEALGGTAGFKGGDIAVIELCVADPTEEGVQLRGKQKLDDGDFWYTAQSGIWQPVWMEAVPSSYIENVRYETDLMESKLVVRARTCGEGALSVKLLDGESEAAYGCAHTHCAHAEVLLDVGNLHLWSPDDPFLYSVILRFEAADGSLDTVHSYCAWRIAEVKPDGSGGSRFYLNGQPLFLKGVLDQGYWPESLMTAPSDAAFVHDILQMKGCGFNMLRKHVKLEASRFYYHCDRLGMLVWQDMVNGGGSYDDACTIYLPTASTFFWRHFSDIDRAHTRKLGGDGRRYRDIWWRTCRRSLYQLGNHPCIVTWVLFNEGWGQFDSAGFARLVRELDPSRPVEAASGWFDQGAGDYFGVHNYFRNQVVFRDWRQRTWRVGRACVTSELGGLVYCLPGHSQVEHGYGFDVYEELPAWQQAVHRLIEELDALEEKGLAGYVYTQLSDVGEETNGILTADRTVNKLALL